MISTIKSVKSVELPGGIQLPYVEQGAPSGIPILLLHGFTDSWYSFEPVLPYLPNWVRAIAPTQRGHGDADRPASGYRTRDFAADVAALMDVLELESAIVVGHSMGATNAQRFAIDYPDRVLGLVLAGSFASFSHNSVAVEFWRSGVSQLHDPIDPAFVRDFQESTLVQPVPSIFLNAVVQESLKVPAYVWRAAFTGLLDDDCVSELDQIKAPTLILWGDRDLFCPRRDQDILLSAIAHSSLVVYEGGGHAFHWEEPKRVANDLVTFATRLVP